MGFDIFFAITEQSLGDERAGIDDTLSLLKISHSLYRDKLRVAGPRAYKPDRLSHSTIPT
jgi:hypothetical protein